MASTMKPVTPYCCQKVIFNIPLHYKFEERSIIPPKKYEWHELASGWLYLTEKTRPRTGTQPKHAGTLISRRISDLYRTNLWICSDGTEEILWKRRPQAYFAVVWTIISPLNGIIVT